MSAYQECFTASTRFRLAAQEALELACKDLDIAVPVLNFCERANDSSEALRTLDGGATLGWTEWRPNQWGQGLHGIPMVWIRADAGLEGRSLAHVVAHEAWHCRQRMTGVWQPGQPEEEQQAHEDSAERYAMLFLTKFSEAYPPKGAPVSAAPALPPTRPTRTLTPATVPTRAAFAQAWGGGRPWHRQPAGRTR
jgi:hypothetical protein